MAQCTRHLANANRRTRNEEFRGEQTGHVPLDRAEPRKGKIKLRADAPCQVDACAGWPTPRHRGDPIWTGHVPYQASNEVSEQESSVHNVPCQADRSSP